MSGYSGRPSRGPAQGGPQQRSNYESEPSLQSIWKDYLKGGYFDETGNLRQEFVERSHVEPLASALSQAKLTTHQLRRFFGHSRGIETRLKSARVSWRELETDFLKLAVAAADARGKRPQKIPDLFHEFIQRNVDAVKSETDFLKGFLPHFEALVGFCSGKLTERN